MRHRKVISLVTLGIILSNTVDAAIDYSDHFGRVVHHLDEFQVYLDENRKLATHLLLYPESCQPIIDLYLINPLITSNDPFNPFFLRKVHPVAGDAEQVLFGTTNTGSTIQCNAVCIELGTDHSLMQYLMPNMYYKYMDHDEGTFINNDKSIDMWYTNNCEHVEFGFINYHAQRELDIMWLDGEGNSVLNRKLGYGENQQEFVPTYLGHTLQVEDPETGEVLLRQVVEFPGMRSVGYYHIPDEAKNPGKDVVDYSIKVELLDQWEKHNKVKRTFSSNGFAKGRLPNDVFAAMDAYYYNNRQFMYMEQWNSADRGLIVNWWDHDVHFMNVPQGLKHTWQIRLLKLVEDWTNTKLEQTAMYGIRQYEPGARLLTHVDRINTHAASLIVNIAQGNITEPWRVEIHDHADRLHELTMQPGDVVYYESAKTLHGRNTPLKGGYYANLFTHYRPVGDPQWYEKENPSGTPEPLIDVGECRLVGSPDIFSEGSATCDDPRIGPHLSPTLFTAHSGEDLFDWWKSRTPQPRAVGSPVEDL